jgi:hypothetical protein
MYLLANYILIRLWMFVNILYACSVREIYTLLYYDFWHTLDKFAICQQPLRYV